MKVEPIATIYNGYIDKFGIPRQSNIARSVGSYIVMNEKYRSPEAFRGIEQFSHLWLLWHFSEAKGEREFSPTVRPPRLGGNTRVGVFATRSPNRPNGIGLSSVRLGRVIKTKEHGIVLEVFGADIKNGTDIFDIKPYIPYTDSHPEAVGGFADEFRDYSLEVTFEGECKSAVDEADLAAVCEILASDPRPSYQNDAERIYCMDYAKYNISFRVDGKTLFVCDIKERENYDGMLLY